MPLHPLEQIVLSTLRTELQLPRRSRILIGASGGADSTALVLLLAALRKLLGLDLVLAYINHGLRPLETDAEWAFVRGLAAGLDLPCQLRSVDVRGHAASRKLSLEHAARELRYQAFAELGQSLSADFLAVGHTADDQVEELLLRLLRGGSRKSLSGMRLRLDWLIRPLLGLGKQDLLAYLAARGYDFCHDSSNDDLQFLRNKIRHDLLPLLEADYGPGLRSALLKTADNLRVDEDLLEQLLGQAWEGVILVNQEGASVIGHKSLQTPLGLPAEVAELEDIKLDLMASAWTDLTVPPSTTVQLQRRPFRKLHSALQRRLLEKLLWSLGNRASYRQILSLMEAALQGKTGGTLHLSQGLRVVIGREALVFAYPRGQGSWRGQLTATEDD